MYQPSRDMKSHSFCSIYKESFNIISSNRKLFTQIAIFLTLPLSIISVLSTPLSSILFPDITIDQLTSSITPENNYTTLFADVSPWTVAAFLVFKLTYASLSVSLSLLSFSAVTYSVVCIYTKHTNITFKATLCAFKKAWKNLVLTWLAEWSVILGSTCLMGLMIIAPIWTLSSGRYQTLGLVAIFIILWVYAGVVIYISIIWIFGSTVAVLETSYGFKALSKSNSLIMGKTYITLRALLPLSSCSGLVASMFLKVVINGELVGLGLMTRIGCGVAALPMMVGLTVFAVVVQTVIYLICKADKGESITTSSVMDHLDIFVDGYAPLLEAKDEQI